MFLQAGVSLLCGLVVRLTTRFDSLNDASQINLELWKLKEFICVMVWLVTNMEVAKNIQKNQTTVLFL